MDVEFTGDYSPHTHVLLSGWKHSRVHARHCLHLSHTLPQTCALQICPVTKDWAVRGASSIIRPRSGLRHAFLQMEVPSLKPASHLPVVKSEDFLLLFPVCPRILVGIKNKPKSRGFHVWFHVQVQVQAPPTALSKGTSMRTGACLTPDLCPTEHQPDEQRAFRGVLKCPSTEEWIKKVWHVYTMEYYSTIKKNEMMPFAATWVEVEIMMLSEVDQTEKDK